MAGSYEQVGSAADVNVSQLNPYSDALMQRLMGTTGMQEFAGAFPQLQNLVNNMTQGYSGTRMQQAQDLAQQTQQNIAGQFADIGALRSSAAMGAIGKGVSSALLGAQTDISQMQTNLLGQFGMGAMGAIGQERNMLAQLATPEYYVYEPTYQYQPGFLDYLFTGLGAAGQAAAGAAGLAGAFPKKAGG